MIFMAKIKEYKLKDGSKRYKFQLYIGIDAKDGKQKNTTRRGFKSVKEAKLALSRLEIEVSEGAFEDKKQGTFQEVYEMWLDGVYQNTVKESTLVKTQELFNNHILPKFGNVKVESIDIDACQTAIDEWFNSIKKYKMLKNYTKRVLDYAINKKYITYNPMNNVIVPVRKSNVTIEDKSSNFFSREELDEFLNHVKQDLSPRWYTFFQLLAYSGMRKGEVLALDWQSVDFENNQIHVTKTLTLGLNNTLIIQSPKTASSIRTIDMDEGTMTNLKRWKVQQAQELLRIGIGTNNPEQPLFTTYQNNYLPPAMTTNRIRSIVKKHNLKYVTCHGLRHTHCSLLFEAGATIREVKDRLGHADISTTMNIYDAVQPKSKLEAASKFSDYMNAGRVGIMK